MSDSTPPNIPSYKIPEKSIKINQINTSSLDDTTPQNITDILAKPTPTRHIPTKESGRGEHGRPLATCDYQQVEKLAALGISGKMIARGLGIGNTTYMKNKVADPEFLAAIERGLHSARVEIATELRAHSKKHFVATIFKAKQSHLLNYTDQQDHQHSGELTLTIKSSHLEEDRSKAIDAEYQDISTDEE